MRMHMACVRTEEGVVALLTLIFMMFIGFTSLTILWGLSYTSGAYTTLYGATQAAAYSAASQVDFGGAGLAQPPFDCGTNWSSSLAGSPPSCVDGKTAEAARGLLRAQLPCSGGPYGLRYCPSNPPAGNVQLIDENGHISNGILAYEIAIAPGAAQAADPDCDGLASANTPEAQGQRTCWRNPYASAGSNPYGVSAVGAPNYSSGVVVVAVASIPFVPGCSLAQICPQLQLLAAVPASTGQQQPFTGTN